MEKIIKNTIECIEKEECIAIFLRGTTKESFINNLISTISNVNIQDNPENIDYNKISYAISKLAEAKLYIDFSQNLNFSYIIEMLKKIKSDNELLIKKLILEDFEINQNQKDELEKEFNITVI